MQPSNPYCYGGYDGSTNDRGEYSRDVNPNGVDLAHGVNGYGYAPYGPYSPAGSPVPRFGHEKFYGAQNYQYSGPYFQLLTPTGGQYSTTNNGVASRTETYLTTQRPMASMRTTTGYMSRMYPNKLYGEYGDTCLFCYGTNAYNFQNNVGDWLNVDYKFKPRSQANCFRGYNNENSEGLYELNRGPIAGTIKYQKSFTQIAIAVKGQNRTLSPTDNIENEPKEVKEFNITHDRKRYNTTEFPETYADAKFFIIKSNSEDDVHKSIKHNVWASTENGNKKLDAAYHEAQQKSGPCPVFLFFSVNKSRQFVGVAEMVGPVDFTNSLDYWQQDRWIGCFPVKWHIVKDIPNSMLKHIVLENNENKPVTNSRDTQEVKLEQGLQMLKIFKQH